MEIITVTGYRSLQNRTFNKEYSKNGVIFQAMKKTQFSGVDRFVVDKYKLPIEKFNGMKDFFNYCGNMIKNIQQADLKGRDHETALQRESILKEWFNYVLKENCAYTNSIALMILDGITKKLKIDNNNIPPVLNKGVLAQTVEQIDNNPAEQIDFDKAYRKNLQEEICGFTDNSVNGWIEIPSKEHDSEHFEENVLKVKMLSHPSWCTKSYNAEPYLEKGDFHIYYENGVPRLGVRFEGDLVAEIEGIENNNKIPISYYTTIKEHIKDFDTTYWCHKQMSQLESTKQTRDNMLEESFPNGLKTYSTQEILEKIGIECKKDEDGLLIISTYKRPHNWWLTFKELGVNENDLFKDIKKIEGRADFYGDGLKNLGNLEEIGGDAYFGSASLTDMGKLKKIKGTADFQYTKMKSLGNIEEVGGDLIIQRSTITDLGKLRKVGGSMNIGWTKISDLGEFEEVGKDLCIYNTPITTLKNLKKIGGSVDFKFTNVDDIGQLEEIEGDANFMGSKIKNLKNLKRIGGYANFSSSNITNIGKLERIDGGCGAYGCPKNVIIQLKKIEDSIKYPDWLLKAAWGELENNW